MENTSQNLKHKHKFKICANKKYCTEKYNVTQAHVHSHTHTINVSVIPCINFFSSVWRERMDNKIWKLSVAMINSEKNLKKKKSSQYANSMQLQIFWLLIHEL